MRKFTFTLGMTVGFVIGSRAGRAPYERLEGAARRVIHHPKVQSALHAAAESAESVRDSALDATTGAMDDVSHAATAAMHQRSRRIRNGSPDVASNVGNGA
jgi:hypothetical protein